MTDKPFLLIKSPDDDLVIVNLSLVRTAVFKRDGTAELNFDPDHSLEINSAQLVDSVAEVLSESCITGSETSAKAALAKFRTKGD